MRAVLIVTALVGCADDATAPPNAPDTAGPPAREPEAPVVLEARWAAPETGAHLVAELYVRTDRPTTLAVRLFDGGPVRTVRFPDRAAAHRVPILGLRPGRDTTAEVVVERDGILTTAALPALFGEPLEPRPELDVLAYRPTEMEPGYRLFNLTEPAGGGVEQLVILDRFLQVAWWYDGDPAYTDVRQLPNGHLLGLAKSEGQAIEFDLLGQPRRVLAPRSPEGGSLRLHHEVYPLEGGGLLALATGRPRSVPDVGVVLSDVVVRLDDRAAVQWSVDLLDVADLGRPVFPRSKRRSDGLLDLLHANAVVPTEDGGAIVSLRHQDAVFRLDADGRLVWILGDPADWSPEHAPLLLEPVGALRWPYHQHAPSWSADGTLVLFDNHNHGRRPGQPAPSDEPASRAVAYRIDEVARTVEQLWEILPAQRLMSSSVGDADPLPTTGNVLIVFGAVGRENGVPNLLRGTGTFHVRLVEAHPQRPSAPALDLRFWTRVGDNPNGVRTYRAEVLPSLYPPGVVVELGDP